jgi:hypothetical protein
MRLTKAGMKAGFKASLDAIFVLGGLGGVGYGCYQIYEPSAFIVVGAALVWIGMPDRHEPS